jgi:hypothetical protein
MVGCPVRPALPTGRLFHALISSVNAFFSSSCRRGEGSARAQAPACAQGAAAARLEHVDPF